MTRKIKPARAVSKQHTGQLSSASRTTVRSISPVMRKFKQLFPKYTAAELMKRTGAKFSHCEKVVTGKRELGSLFQQKLLQSDVGKPILIVIMGESKADWWVGFHRHLKLADLVKAQARTQASIEAVQRELAS